MPPSMAATCPDSLVAAFRSKPTSAVWQAKCLKAVSDALQAANAAGVLWPAPLQAKLVKAVLAAMACGKGADVVLFGCDVLKRLLRGVFTAGDGTAPVGDWVPTVLARVDWCMARFPCVADIQRGCLEVLALTHAEWTAERTAALLPVFARHCQVDCSMATLTAQCLGLAALETELLRRERGDVCPDLLHVLQDLTAALCRTVPLYPTQPKFLVVALGALGGLVCLHPGLLRVMDADGGFRKVVVGVMRQNCAEPLILSAGAFVGAKLARVRVPVMDQEGFGAILGAMGDAIEHCDAVGVQNAASCMADLLMRVPTAAVDTHGASELLKRLVRAMKVSLLEQDTQIQCFRAIRALLLTGGRLPLTARLLPVATRDVFHVSMAAMAAHAESCETASVACHVMSLLNFWTLPELVPRMGDVCRTVTCVLALYGVRFQDTAGYGLQVLSVAARLNPSWLRDNGSVEQVLLCMGAFPAAAAVQARGCKVLAGVAADGRAPPQATQAVMAALAAHPEHPDVCRAARDACRALAKTAPAEGDKVSTYAALGLAAFMARRGCLRNCAPLPATTPSAPRLALPF